MKIVIDMQGAQTISRFRGIGRYTMSLAKAIARNKGEHEVILALNGLFPESIESIRAEFYGLLPQENIRVWYAPGPVADMDPTNKARQEAAELMREAFLRSLQPDVILIVSLFEGYSDDAVTSIGKLDNNTPVSVVLHDLIPLIHQERYLGDPNFRNHYFEKIQSIKRAKLLLSVSESSAQEAITHLSWSSDGVVNISAAADDFFKPVRISPVEAEGLYKKFGISKPFILHVGAADDRKNFRGLIEAYIALPQTLRSDVQLVIAGKLPKAYIAHLLQGIEYNSNILFTGEKEVSDNDLLKLYNLCKLFVFPSIHEGFGLPVLEAMACGAPVIASNCSSLPEVVGLKEALFDPYSVTSIQQKIEQALINPEFLESLRQHGLKQAKNFSWDKSAKRALVALEALVSKADSRIEIVSGNQRQRLAYFSPLPPARSGISNYSAELLPELSKYYDIDVIVQQTETVSDPWIRKHLPIRKLGWFLKNSSNFDRILYHFGNSPFHCHMFDILERYPGVVVLHDYFLSGALSFLEHSNTGSTDWRDALYYSHGYQALHEKITESDLNSIIKKYSCNLAVLQRALGVITHNRYSLDLAHSDYTVVNKEKWQCVPLARRFRGACDSLNKELVRAELGFAKDDLIVCSFGILGPTKLNKRLLDAWLKSTLSRKENAFLIFVGQSNSDDYGREIIECIQSSGCQERIRITGWIDEELYKKYLIAADMGVQLRTLSRRETSAAVLDCMNFGLATVVNGNGSMAELSPEAVVILPDEFKDSDLVQALEELDADPAARLKLGKKAQEIIKEFHDPAKCARQYYDFIERVYYDPAVSSSILVRKLGELKLNKKEQIVSALCLARNVPPDVRKRTIFVDISELVRIDAKTGIQRVVRSILREWLLNPPKGVRVEPVYAALGQEYRYARQFTQRFLGVPKQSLIDEPIDFCADDIFFSLDLAPHIQPSHSSFFERLRNHGVKVYFLVYDLLPVLRPDCFPGAADKGFSDWLRLVGESDGAICISKAVADELTCWMSDKEWNRMRPFKISYFHLGADIENSQPTKGLPRNGIEIIHNLNSKTTFLMVGTVEPRKGHRQTLNAFELLWQNGIDVNLVIVGKSGWMMDDFITKLRSHPELNRRLYWLEGVSDEFLEKIYNASNCLIAASEAEGFGLPLIEAAKNDLSIIARDIPVFREVAGEHAFYFKGMDPEDISCAVKKWLELYKLKKHPESKRMTWLTWKESAQKLMEILLETA